MSLTDKLHLNQTDKVIKGEIPDENDFEFRCIVIKKNMVHGRCVPFNVEFPCMKNGKCSKNTLASLLRKPK